MDLQSSGSGQLENILLKTSERFLKACSRTLFLNCAQQSDLEPRHIGAAKELDLRRRLKPALHVCIVRSCSEHRLRCPPKDRSCDRACCDRKNRITCALAISQPKHVVFASYMKADTIPIVPRVSSMFYDIRNLGHSRAQE